MNAQKTIYQGEDVVLFVELFDDNGVAVNLDELTDIILYLNLYDRKVLRIAKTDENLKFEKVTEIKYRAVISSELTKTLAPGKYVAELNFVFNSNLLQDNRLNKITTTEIFTVKKTLVRHES